MDTTTGAPEAGASAPLRPQRLEIRFVGSGSEYFRIWLVNLLLTLVTLGLYYPFAKVRRLRYFHNATELGGHPLSFHGDPWKMLRGTLLVVAMVAAYSLAGHFSPLAGGLAFLVVALLWPALWHSSMRFRLANTGWRGLRLRYTGSVAQAYAVFAAPVLALGAVIAASVFSATEPGVEPSTAQVLQGTLPLLLYFGLLPVFLWLIKRQQHRHYALADQLTGFDVGAGRFYGLALRSFGVLLGGVAVLAAAVALFALLQAGAPLAAGLAGGFTLVLAAAVMLGYLFVLTVVVGHFTARLQNLVWNGTRSAGLAVHSAVSAKALALLWLKNWLLVVFTLGLYYPFAAIATARLRLQAVQLHSDIDLDTLTARGSAADESAAGDAAGDLFGFDVGL